LVRLGDGSAIRLDTDTRVAVSVTASQRHIRLEHGQAFFEVAHDAARPFIVDAGPMRVRAVGTKFDVRQEGRQARVTLVEGVIQVRSLSGGPGEWTLKPGEQVSLGAARVISVADVRAATSWTQGRIVFQGMPLARAIDEINRYTPHKIRLKDTKVAAASVTGSFETADSGAFVAAVSDLSGLRATTLPDGSIVLDANPSAAN
jgi:transmembrane sensor